MPTEPPPKDGTHRFCWNDIVLAQEEEQERVPDDPDDLDRIIDFVQDIKDEKSSG